MDVGLGYIKLGQSAVTLSSSEAQRIKLARELAQRDTGKTLCILDEPTTGLHFQDISMLLSVLQRLVDTGNTIIVIEQNLDVIKTPDSQSGGAGQLNDHPLWAGTTDKKRQQNHHDDGKQNEYDFGVLFHVMRSLT